MTSITASLVSPSFSPLDTNISPSLPLPDPTLPTLAAAKSPLHPSIHPSLFTYLLTTTTALANASTIGKQALKANTDQAFADGAFGLPYMVCTNATGQTEGFWGVDHMGQVLRFMGLERPREGGWKALL